MQLKLVETPVAVIVYNRPDHTRKLIEKLAKFKFKHLVFIADGPRTVADKERCSEVREMVKVDWGCEVDYVFSDINLGCKERVVSGLNYVFGKFESAIILEDDCVPADSFFEYCELMLDRYRFDDRILMACGTVLVEPKNNPFSYFFSNVPHIWGWASWSNRWKRYNKDVKEYRDLYELNRLAKTYPEPFCWNLTNLLEKIEAGKLDTWDAQMTYLAVSQNLLSIFPNKNLIKNIGFDMEATHTTDVSVLGNRRTSAFDISVKHPTVVVPLRATDLDRMLLEGFAGNVLVRIFKILKMKNGVLQLVTKSFKKIGIKK